MCLYETTIYDVPHFISKLSSIHLKIKLRQYAFEGKILKFYSDIRYYYDEGILLKAFKLPRGS